LCVWFNVPLEDEQGANGEEAFNGEQGTNGEGIPNGEADGARVRIFKYICPPGFDYANVEADAGDFVADCGTPHADVDFSLVYGGDSDLSTTDSAGMALFEDVPYGEVSILKVSQ